MLDNSQLSDFVKKNLQYLSYENKVNIYDNNCSDCTFKKITTINAYGKEVEYKELSDAIDKCLFNENIHIKRGCQYAGDEYTLDEITSNTCRLWYNETIEGGDNEDDSIISMEMIDIEDRNLREVSPSKVIS